MAKVNKDNLGYLGFDFQLRLLSQLVIDRKFSNSIISIIDPNYFEDPYIRVIAAAIKSAHEQHEVIPDIKSLEARLLESISDEKTIKYVLAQIQQIKVVELNDYLFIQETAMKFCKQQELKKSVREIEKIIERGDIDDYDKCEEILRKALDHGDNKDDGINVTDNIEEVLSESFRNPIATGINGLDEIMDGGLGRGELGVILAPFGVGKTTMMTKIANTAKDDGKNVLQIFFEDIPRVIQRKHLACWSKYNLLNLELHRKELVELSERKTLEPGILRLKKFASHGTTIPMIKQYIRKLMAQGFRPDLILLDYIDCVEPSKKFDDVNVGEGAVMRQFETLISELDIPGWTAVQGNRSSIGANLVEAQQMGGSIKKGQIGHFIVSIAKTLEQKENGTATMAILKSRFGKDGIIFDNIVFDNGTIQIDMGVNKIGRTQLEHKKDVDVKDKQRVNIVFEAAKLRKETLNGETVLDNNKDNKINTNG